MSVQSLWWLLVDWYCQNGIPLQGVYELRSRLIGPHAVTGLLVKDRREKKKKENPEKFVCLPGENISLSKVGSWTRGVQML
jgi:hypothetical protein